MKLFLKSCVTFLLVFSFASIAFAYTPVPESDVDWGNTGTAPKPGSHHVWLTRRGLPNYGQMTFNSSLVQYARMTDAEKVLTAGAMEKSHQMPYCERLILYAKAYFRTTGLRAVPSIPLEYYRSKYPSGSVQQKFEELYTSPVTGKPIEVNHPEFSRGNAYVHILTQEEVSFLVSYDKALGMYFEDDRGEKNAVPCVYVRIYGEKGVLVEGLN